MTPDQIQDQILRACTHEPKSSEVYMQGTRKGEVLRVCTDCWNQSVYARRDAEKAEKEAWKRENPCEVKGCKGAANWNVGGVGLCGKHKRLAQQNAEKAIAKSGLAYLGMFGGIAYTRESILEFATQKGS